ncbi:hypothetical protein EOB59_31575 [Mesorhizobium sp. M7A.F.Ca.MR.176.00.0.0]|uniref:hypothetical protein n=1 Tax=Mesorhizobium sp. M7A.F.Ca.MR.176.00.0.0 TaxID=2496776 RepID=UPI000FD4C9E2|nr:hypothetical protein [Mesorhizobium sp. M7A.F.Ca.MR.176.00.0.0]RUU85598.1 hypothetical protein EOB59_31575 [Mesorhizobium sp. M7A.F.Ca.MR.176.00.0.0]
MEKSDRLAKVESRISLSQQVVGGVGWALSYFGLWPYLIAAGLAVFAALYRVLGLVGQYGWAGWFLLALASVVVVALAASAVFSAQANYKRAKKNPTDTGRSELGSMFAAATGVGELKGQLDTFEEDTRAALNSIQFKMDIYNRSVSKISDSYSSLRLLRRADKANRELTLARTFMDKVLNGEWSDWVKWSSAKETMEGYLRTYAHQMRNFIQADEDIFKVSAYQYAPNWLGDRKINFPDDQVKHEFLTLLAYLHNARDTHVKLLSRFASRVVPDSAL